MKLTYSDVNKAKKKKILADEIKKILLTVFMVILGLLNITPFIFMISSSFKVLGKVFEYPIRIIPKPFILDNYAAIFDPQYMFTTWYKNSIIMELLTISLKFFVVTITAYAFARLKFRGRDKLFIFFLAGLMLPGDVTLVQRYIVYKMMNITDTVWALVLPAAFDMYFVFLLRQFFITIPFELTEAAIVDGCSHFKIFYKIILPLAKPALITMVLFTFVWAWNDYTNPFIFITQTNRQMLTVGISMFQMMRFQNYAQQMAASSLSLIPILAVFLVSQRYFIKGLVAGSVKG